MRNSITLALLAICTFLAACATPPKSFVQTAEANWNNIELREGLSYDDAWSSVVDLISKRFDIEIVSKEDGYLRSGWMYAWTGELNKYYRVRVIIKFSNDHKVVAVKSEAYFQNLMGTDESLVSTMRSDLMATVGRVTR
jgi:hypothetical protein